MAQWYVADSSLCISSGRPHHSNAGRRRASGVQDFWRWGHWFNPARTDRTGGIRETLGFDNPRCFFPQWLELALSTGLDPVRWHSPGNETGSESFFKSLSLRPASCGSVAFVCLVPGMLCTHLRLSFTVKVGSRFEAVCWTQAIKALRATVQRSERSVGVALAETPVGWLSAMAELHCKGRAWSTGIREDLNLTVNSHRYGYLGREEEGRGAGRWIHRPTDWGDGGSLHFPLKRNFGTKVTLTLSLLRVINVKFLLQPHQKYYITQ